MRIDLRIPMIIAAFYAPGLMMLFGAWMLGYSTVEVRELVAGIGALGGVTLASTAAIHLFHDRGPVWWTIPGTKGDNQ